MAIPTIFRSFSYLISVNKKNKRFREKIALKGVNETTYEDKI